MCLLCKQLSHILVLLHRKWLNLYTYAVFEIARRTGAQDQQKQRRSSKTAV